MKILSVASSIAASVAFVTAVKAGTSIPPDRHVVVVVWDGMRPDQVSQQQTPTLWKLGQEGVVFRNSHSVYFSATNVNGRW